MAGNYELGEAIMILPVMIMDVILDANDHLKNTFSDQQASLSLINSKTTLLMYQVIYEYPLLDIEYPYIVINIMK